MNCRVFFNYNDFLLFPIFRYKSFSMRNFALIIFLSFLITGCDALSTQNTVTVAQLETQLNDIRNFVNQEGCNTGGECSYLPIGSKACGGPVDYIIFSNTIDVETLKKMVEKFTEDQKRYNIENNVMSDCRFVTPPEKVDCVDGSCIEIR